MSDETIDISARNRRVNSCAMKTVSTVAGKLVNDQMEREKINKKRMGQLRKYM